MSIYGNPVMLGGSGGGGGGGVVLSGTSSPTASLGNDEDLYIQYEILSASYDHTYKIVAEYRKVNGSWVAYAPPALPTLGIHVWTKSTGGSDAAMWVQKGYWDDSTQQFVTTDEPVSYVYREAGNGINLYDLAILRYGNVNWSLTASVTLTDGTNTYTADTVINTWQYSANYNVIVWKPGT